MSPPQVLRTAIYVLAALFIAVGLYSLRPSPSDDNPPRDILAADLARRMHANALALDSSRSELARRGTGVTRDVVRYRTLHDTLNVHDTVAVKEFVARSDSVVRSCTAYVESCDRFRVRADSSLASLTTDRDFWRARFESAKPSKWDGVKEWGIRLGIGYAAFKLGQGVR